MGESEYLPRRVLTTTLSRTNSGCAPEALPLCCSGKEAMLITTRRLGAALTGAAITLSPLAVMPSAGAATAPTSALDDSVAWLQGELNDQGLLPGFGTADFGLTADYAKGLQEVGRVSELQAVAADLLAAKDSFIGDGTSKAKGAATAQALWASELDGTPDAGLVSRLEAQIAAGGEAVDTGAGTRTVAADAAGRLIDKPYSSWTGTIDQTWAVAALSAAGSSKAGAAADFLLKQQCGAGYFRLTWADVDGANQSCDSSSDPNPDATAYAVILLSGLPSPSTAVTSAVNNASAWLMTKQRADGSFAGDQWTPAPNANSTGLAVRALGLTGHIAEAAKGARWLRGHQAVSAVGCPTPLDRDNGAIAYDDPAIASARTSGIDPAGRGSWQYAAGQAFAALKWLPAASSRPTIAGPTGYRSGGSVATYRATGASAGEPVCFAAGSAKKLVIAASNGAASAALRLPVRTVNLTASVADHAGVTSRTVTKVLGATTPRMTLSRTQVRRGQVLVVRVAGLASGERVSVKFRRATAKSGMTTSTGRYTARVRVTKALAQRLGRARVTVTGQFADRTNHKTVRVVR